MQFSDRAEVFTVKKVLAAPALLLTLLTLSASAIPLTGSIPRGANPRWNQSKDLALTDRAIPPFPKRIDLAQLEKESNELARGRRLDPSGSKAFARERYPKTSSKN